MTGSSNIRQSPLFFIPFLLMILCPVTVRADAENTLKENSKAVVLVTAFNEKNEPLVQESGFIVRADGAIVTNYQVISKAKNITIATGERTLAVEGVIHEDAENNLVILKAKGENLPTVTIGDSGRTGLGEPVLVIGSAHGLPNIVTKGTLEGIRYITSSKKVLQITAPGFSGIRGGVVFNRYGEAIGIVTFLPGKEKDLVFATPLSSLSGKIENKQVTALKGPVAGDNKETADHLFNEGIARLRAGRLHEALEAFQGAIRIKPDLAPAHYNLGNVYAKSDMYAEAIESYKQAIRIEPDLAEAHTNLGVVYGIKGMSQEAIESYREAIRIKPDFALAHYNLGNVYKESGMRSEAIESYKEAIRIEPDFAPAYYNLGNAYSESGMRAEAIESYKEAIRIEPDFAEAQYNLGITYDESGLYHEAIEAYKEAIRIKPDYPETHLALGTTYTILDNRGAALEEYKILKEINKEMARKLFELIYREL